MIDGIVTDEEKIHILNQHIKNAAYSLYNVEVSLLAENSLTSKDQNTIDSLSQQKTDYEEKIAAMQAEIALIEGV